MVKPGNKTSNIFIQKNYIDCLHALNFVFYIVNVQMETTWPEEKIQPEACMRGIPRKGCSGGTHLFGGGFVTPPGQCGLEDNLKDTDQGGGDLSLAQII